MREFAWLGVKLTMDEDLDDEEKGSDEAEATKTKALDNPWFALATIYGVPDYADQELQDKNRRIWNKYYAKNLDTKTRELLTEDYGCSEDELTPLTQEELQTVKSLFHTRASYPFLPNMNLHVHRTKYFIIPDSEHDIDFRDVKFDTHLEFNNYIFCRANFRGAIFEHGADFEGATFFGWVDFGTANFSKPVNFADTRFITRTGGDTWFLGAVFSRSATFVNATFSMLTDFSGAKFHYPVHFDGAVFNRLVTFKKSTFAAWAGFSETAFVQVDFTDATFGATADFRYAKIKSETSFTGVDFNLAPPAFLHAELYQGTDWNVKNWPLPVAANVAKPFIDSYASLKLEMDRLKKHEDELDFFALELQSRRVLLGWKGLPIAIYGVLSDYGRSYVRPLVALLVVAAIGAAAFWCFDARTFGEALGLSAANTLNVFGFRREFYLSIETPFACIKVLAALQTVLGTILLFLFGLGIRNKFRMK